MSKDRIIHLEEYRQRRGAEHRLITTHGIATLLADIQLPFSADQAGRLAAQGAITLGEGFSLIQNATLQDDRYASGYRKIMEIRTDLMAQLRGVATALLENQRPEAIPILLASDIFLDDDIQEKIHENSKFYEKDTWWNLLQRAFLFQDNGGAVIFPSFDDLIPAVTAIKARKQETRFRTYHGGRLHHLIQDKSTDVEMAAEMIRPFRSMPDLSLL